MWANLPIFLTEANQALWHPSLDCISEVLCITLLNVMSGCSPRLVLGVQGCVLICPIVLTYMTIQVHIALDNAYYPIYFQFHTLKDKPNKPERNNVQSIK